MEIKEEYFPKPPEAEPKILDTLTIPATEEEAYKYLTVDILDIMDLLRKEISDEDFTKNPALLSGRFLGILHKMSELLTDTLGQGKSTNQLKLLYADVFQNRKTGCYLYTFTLDFVKDKPLLRKSFLTDLESNTGIFWQTLTAERQNYTRPQDHIFLLPKAVNAIFAKEETGVERINVGTDSTPVKVGINVWEAIDGENIKYTNKLTPYDKEVYNAIASIVDSGNNDFTIKQLYDVLNDKLSNHPTNKSLTEVLNSILKMQLTMVYLDYREQYQKHKILKHQENTETLEGTIAPLLSGKIDLKRINGLNGTTGELKTVFTLTATPILYEYAKKLKQIATIPRVVLDAPVSGINSNIIKGELARRTSAMRNSKKKKQEKQRTILVKTVLENCKIVIPANNRHAYFRYTEMMIRIMDTMVETKWIKGYTCRKEGKRITAFENIRF